MSSRAIQNPTSSRNFAVFSSIAELDQYREIVRKASLEVVQLKPGKLRAVLAQADLGPSSIHWNRYGLPLRGRGTTSFEHWSFLWFPDSIAGVYNSHVLTGNMLLAYPPAAEFEGSISGSCHHWIATVTVDELTRSYEAISQQDFKLLQGGLKSLLLHPKHLKKLRSIATKTAMLAKDSPQLLTDDKVRMTIHKAFVDNLALALYSSAGEQPRRATQQSHSKIVHLAEQFIFSHDEMPVAVSDLCRATAATERTLERAFRNVVGLTPQKYLQVIRLNRANAELKRSSREVTTVTDAAMRAGFFHFGRFAATYKQFFGELPSDTLTMNGHA